MTGVRWLAKLPEYWLEPEAWFEAMPIDDGYADLGASIAMLSRCGLNYPEIRLRMTVRLTVRGE